MHLSARRKISYLALLLVVVTWGLDPVIMSYFYRYYSATVLALISAVLSAVFFFALSWKKRGLFSKKYIKIAVPLGALTTVASLLQKIGLQYTTPANYAFLEHLSCVVVPIALLFLVRKRPSLWQALSCVCCLVGCFFLCGADASLGIGEILCGASGLLYGVCVAGTGVYAQELEITHYMSVYMTVYALISAVTVFVLDGVCVGGVPLERAMFTLDAKLLLGACAYGLLTVGICWLCKNLATVYTDPTVVAVICPFSAVISVVLSLAMGQDRFSVALIAGAALVMIAVITCAIDDLRADKKST